MMISPGLNENEIKELKVLGSELPVSYINAASKFNLNGIIIGYFLVSPFSYNPKGIVESLKEANGDPFFPKEFMEKHRMYQVGSYNTDLICVTSGTDQFENGEILFVDEGFDIYNPEDSQIHPLAKDFEQFLIIAGNLNQVQREVEEDNSNHEAKKQEFLERLQKLGFTEKYHNMWLSLF